MVAGTWLNQDGLYVQFGTQKAIPELGGDYLMYGENREIETFINLGATQFGTGTSPQNPPLPSSFQGTIASQTATANTGIVSYTTLFPLQTAPAIPTISGGLLTIVNPQLYIDQVDLEVVVAANAGTGGATGLTGIGLVIDVGGTTPSWQQVTPNAGVQLVGAATNAKLAANMHYTWYADGSSFGTGTPPVAGSWLGSVPVVTNSVTPLPQYALISAIASGGTFTGTTGGGLLRLRVRYHLFGVINQ